MRLIQAKARCVEGVRDSGWFVPGRHTTVIHDPEGASVPFLFEALQTLNPPYPITECKPFSSHPQSWRQGSYDRKVIPGKKTAVIMVFSAVPDLVRELSEIDESLFETDRIEVGRRLDYSRWITFVEISASGRWSDIKSDFQQLRKLMRTPEGQVDDSAFNDLLDSNRLKGELADRCRNWLVRIKDLVPELGGEELLVHQRCLRQVNLAERFNQARRRVEKWLPPTLVVPCHHFGSETVSEQLEAASGPAAFLLDRLQDTCSEGPDSRLSLEQDQAKTLRELEGEEAFRDLLARPRLEFHRERISITGLEADSALLLLKKHIYLLCLLSLLVQGRKPLLLLDLPHRAVCQMDVGTLLDWLQQLGKSCQVIIGTDSAELANGQGWQSVFRVGEEGLGEHMLSKESDSG